MEYSVNQSISFLLYPDSKKENALWKRWDIKLVKRIDILKDLCQNKVTVYN